MRNLRLRLRLNMIWQRFSLLSYIHNGHLDLIICKGVPRRIDKEKNKNVYRLLNINNCSPKSELLLSKNLQKYITRKNKITTTISLTTIYIAKYKVLEPI